MVQPHHEWCHEPELPPSHKGGIQGQHSGVVELLHQGGLSDEGSLQHAGTTRPLPAQSSDPAWCCCIMRPAITMHAASNRGKHQHSCIMAAAWLSPNKAQLVGLPAVWLCPTAWVHSSQHNSPLTVACMQSMQGCAHTRSQFKSRSRRLMATVSSYSLQRPLNTCATRQ